jgi:hypothetical protein
LQGKEKRGLSIKYLRKLNLSLICKWWWSLENEDGLWQDIVKLKYIKETPICLVQRRQSDCTVWSDLLKVRHVYIQGRVIQVKNEKGVSFWLDTWLGDKSMCCSYPLLYELCVDQKCSVHKVWMEGWVVQFKISLPYYQGTMI